jgi:hypothetical protein
MIKPAAANSDSLVNADANVLAVFMLKLLKNDPKGAVSLARPPSVVKRA